MADVRRVTPGIQKDVDRELERMQIIERLRHESVHEVFSTAKAFKIADFADFFSNRWKAFKGQILQDVEVRALEADVPPPEHADFPLMERGIALTREESEMLTAGLLGSLGGKAQKFKAQVVEWEPAASGENEPMTADELDEMARGTMAEWESFLEETWMQIFDAQMMSDYKSRMAEVQKEAERLIRLAKEGKVGAEFVLIALAKVNQTKNGVLMSWLGKKAFHMNDSMNKIAEDLHKGGGADFANLQYAQSKTRDMSFQMNLVMSDMQKVMQDVASVMEQVHGMMGEINRTRREMIMKLSATGG